MADWTLQEQWRLNGQVVPFDQSKANIEDVWQLTESGDQVNVDLFFLNLKATAGPWLDKAPQLKSRQWFYHSGTLPFLQEVKEAIAKAQAEFAFLRQRDILVIQIRENVLKVQMISGRFALRSKKRDRGEAHLVPFRDQEGHRGIRAKRPRGLKGREAEHRWRRRDAHRKLSSSA